MIYTNLEAIIGQSFTIGYGGTSLTMTVSRDENNRIGIQFTGDVKGERFSSSYTANSDEDLCNLATVLNLLKNSEDGTYGYIDSKIAEMTGGTTGNNVMLLPISVNVNDITVDVEYAQSFGNLIRNKFVDRIVFEILTPFYKANGKELQFSVGTAADPEAFVPKFGIDELQTTKVVDVFKTLDETTEFKLYAYLEPDDPDPGPDPEPEPEDPYDREFVQRVDNNHPEVSSSMSTDASGNIVNITLSGDNLTPSVLDTGTFGEVTGNYMDFSVNIPLRVTGECHYRVVQMNPALAYYDGKDEFVSNIDGVWTKDKSYTIREDEMELLMSFLLTQSAGSEDYVHLYIYDLDSEHPEDAFRTYHIKNELNFASSSTEGTPEEGEESENTPSENEISTMSLSNEITPLRYSYISAHTSAVGVVQNGSQTIVTLKGVVNDDSEVVKHAIATFPDGIRATLFSIFVSASQIPIEGCVIEIFNPIYEKMDADEGEIDVGNFVDNEGNIQVGAKLELAVQGVQGDGIWVDVPITEYNEYPIQVIITNLQTNTPTIYTINNELTFIESEEELTARYELKEAIQVKKASLSAAPRAAGDTGLMKVRILSF